MWALGSLSYCVTQYSCLEPEDFGIYREREKKKYVGSVINNYIASQKQIGIPVASMCFPSSQSSMYISGAQADEFCTGLQVN